ncbi:MAG: tetratricopeptide repeat protein [Candidatus Acidiferrales bacterium]
MPVAVPPTLRRFAPRTISRIALCAFAFLTLAPQLAAQQNSTPGWPLHNSAPDHATADATGAMPTFGPDLDESCLLWTITQSHAATVSAATLKIPGNAKGEYRKSCSDLKDKKLASAEEHLRKALEDYPQYAAAWALLGQVLEAGNKIPEARDACSQASAADTGYAPAYLCLADVAAHVHDWHLTLDMADRSLALVPQHNVYGSFYSAMAQFHLEQFPEAESDALKTIDADHSHRIPQAHLLLAQIYNARHDPRGAAYELRAYLKIAPNAPDADTVKKTLADVEAQAQK